MGRRRTQLLSDRAVTGIAEATAERVMLSGELLKALAEAMGANAKIQRRFMYTVIHKLTKMETVLSLLHVRNLARDQRPFHYYEDKFIKDTQDSDEWISQKSG